VFVCVCDLAERSAALWARLMRARPNGGGPDIGRGGAMGERPVGRCRCGRIESDGGVIGRARRRTQAAIYMRNARSVCGGGGGGARASFSKMDSRTR
jgi:hypothetical protein